MFSFLQDGDLEAYLLKGNRRVSYLIATATSPTTTLPHKLSDISNPEADDEDSDTLNVSKLSQFPIYAKAQTEIFSKT